MPHGALPRAPAPGFRKDSPNLRLGAKRPRETRPAGRLRHGNALDDPVRMNRSADVWNTRCAKPLNSRPARKAQPRRTDMANDDVLIQIEEPANPSGVPQAGQNMRGPARAFGSADWPRKSAIHGTDGTAAGGLRVRLPRLTMLQAVPPDPRQPLRGGAQRGQPPVRDAERAAREDPEHGAAQLPRPHRSPCRAPQGGAVAPDAGASERRQSAPASGWPAISCDAGSAAGRSDPPAGKLAARRAVPQLDAARRVALPVHCRANLQLDNGRNFGRWEPPLHVPEAGPWLAVAAKFHFPVGHTWQRHLSDRLLVIPVFDGCAGRITAGQSGSPDDPTQLTAGNPNALAPLMVEITPKRIEFRSLLWKDDRGRRGSIGLAPARAWASRPARPGRAAGAACHGTRVGEWKSSTSARPKPISPRRAGGRGRYGATTRRCPTVRLPARKALRAGHCGSPRQAGFRPAAHGEAPLGRVPRPPEGFRDRTPCLRNAAGRSQAVLPGILDVIR